MLNVPLFDLCNYFYYYIYQIPLTNPYPGPQSVLVLDNCNIHHSEDVHELIEDEAGQSQLYSSRFIES